MVGGKRGDDWSEISKVGHETSTDSMMTRPRVNTPFMTATAKSTYMVQQSLLYEGPALLQIRLSVLWEKCGERTSLQQATRVVLSSKRWLLPAIGYSVQFWL